MIWTGKLTAGLIGASIGGPLAGLLAAGFAHSLDREIAGYSLAFRRQESAAWRRYWHGLLFAAEFLLAGHLARVGDLTPPAADAGFRALCGRRALSRSDAARALDLFLDGRRADFPCNDYLNQFRREIHRQADLAAHLLTALLYFERLADQRNAAQDQVLAGIARRLGVSPAALAALAQAADFEPGRRAASAGIGFAEACAILGVGPDASHSEVRRAYRLQMSRHHPDKLMHEEPSPARLAQAAERTHRIRQAYDTLSARDRR